MLRPVEMQKIRLLLPKSIMSTVIARLHDMGIVEITSSENEGLDKGAPLERYDEIAEQLVRIRAIKKALENGNTKPQQMEWEKALLEAKGLRIDDEIKQISESLEKLKNARATLIENLQLVQRLQVLGNVDFSRLRTENLDYWLGKASKKTAAAIAKDVSENAKDYSITTTNLSKTEELMLIVYRKSTNMQDKVAYTDVQEIEVPRGTAVPADSMQSIRQQLELNDNETMELKSRLHELSQKYYARVTDIEKALAIMADRAEISFKFGFTEKAAVVEGWVKAADFGKVVEDMRNISDAIAVQKAEAGEHDIPPTSLKNPKVTGPYQFLTEMFSLPNAREIDPSMIYMITIPLLYGMIVGDVLYGVASFFIGRWIVKKFNKSIMMQNVGTIWMVSAIPSIVFGLLFDEWAGMGHVHLIEILGQWGLPIAIHEPLYLPFVHRIEELTALIGITVLVGLLHLGLGFLLGAINEWGHSKKHAVAKLSWILLEITGSMAVGAYLLNLFPAEIGMIGAIGVGISALLLLLTEGIIGILEMPGLAGNILSYARIAAIGVVGVALAEIINQIFTPLPEQGILALIFFPLFVILHGLNAFIAMFESLIQGGRLNIIEFRSKFLKGGGKPFEPFSYSY